MAVKEINCLLNFPVLFSTPRRVDEIMGGAT